MENTNTIRFPDDQPSFYLADGASYKGPFRPSEIYAMLESSQASWVDLCYREKEGQWMRIADHPVFKAVQAEPPKPPKPPVASAPPPPPKAPEPPTKWFVYQNDTQTGPYPTSEITRLLASQQIQTHAFVWQEKFTEWKPISQIDEFKSLPGASSPPVAAQPAKASERRTAPRKPLVAQLSITNLKEVMTGLCRDISVGGMQVLCEKVPGQAGETIRLNVLPPDSTGLKAFVAEGVIVRILEDKKGFSFRFTKLNDEAKNAIERYIS
jgi:hypothetical protein